jgi:hypothetical protein
MRMINKQRFWRGHLLAAKCEQLTYVDYAKQHDLNLQALYYWSMILRRKGPLEQPAFVELKVTTRSKTPQRVQIYTV